MQYKKSFKTNTQYYNIHHLGFKGSSEMYCLGFIERLHFQIVNYFSIPIMAGSLEYTFATNVSLVSPLLTNIHGH